MEIVEYHVPEVCFPRYQYTKKIRKELAKRYNNLMKTLELEDKLSEDYQSDGYEEKICMILCKDPTTRELIPSIQSIVPRKGENITEGNRVKLTDLKDLIAKETEHFRRNTFVITNCDIFKEIKGSKGHKILISNDDERTEFLRKYADHENIDVCPELNVVKVVSFHLERNAFTGLKTACENLDSILEEKMLQDSKNPYVSKISVEHGDKAEGTFIKAEEEQRNKKRSHSAKEGYNGSARIIPKRTRSASENSKKEKSSNDRRIKTLSKELKDLLERLFDEIVGMFNRSNLPKAEHPLPNFKIERKMNETLLSELQRLSPQIVSCGYRFSTFLVYIKGEFDSEKLKQDIKEIVERNNIKEFSIHSPDIKEFATCRVGSKIAVKTVNGRHVFGTLGGFARTRSGDSEQTLALMSRHVINCSCDDNIYVRNGNERTVAKLFKQANEADKQYLDIAAASLDNNARTRCDTRYITEDKVSVPGKLCSYDTDKLQGLPVHIKGASTQLGLGTITIPEQTSVQNDDLRKNYIVVEDRAGKGAFCKEGDSGAIVCAENPDRYGEEVQLISMVIGENLSKKGSYSTLRLDKGIAELESLTEKEINLC